MNGLEYTGDHDDHDHEEEVPIEPAAKWPRLVLRPSTSVFQANVPPRDVDLTVWQSLCEDYESMVSDPYQQLIIKLWPIWGFLLSSFCYIFWQFHGWLPNLIGWASLISLACAMVIYVHEKQHNWLAAFWAKQQMKHGITVCNVDHKSSTSPSSPISSKEMGCHIPWEKMTEILFPPAGRTGDIFCDEDADEKEIITIPVPISLVFPSEQVYSPNESLHRAWPRISANFNAFVGAHVGRYLLTAATCAVAYFAACIYVTLSLYTDAVTPLSHPTILLGCLLVAWTTQHAMANHILPQKMLEFCEAHPSLTLKRDFSADHGYREVNPNKRHHALYTASQYGQYVLEFVGPRDDVEHNAKDDFIVGVARERSCVEDCSEFHDDERRELRPLM